jgi:hypothetical protein
MLRARSCSMQLLRGSWFMQHAAGQSIKEIDGSMQLAPWRPVWRGNSPPHFWRRSVWRVAAVAMTKQGLVINQTLTKFIVANLIFGVASYGQQPNIKCAGCSAPLLWRTFPAPHSVVSFAPDDSAASSTVSSSKQLRQKGVARHPLWRGRVWLQTKQPQRARLQRAAATRRAYDSALKALCLVLVISDNA